MNECWPSSTVVSAPLHINLSPFHSLPSFLFIFQDRFSTWKPHLCNNLLSLFLIFVDSLSDFQNEIRGSSTDACEFRELSADQSRTSVTNLVPIRAEQTNKSTVSCAHVYADNYNITSYIYIVTTMFHRQLTMWWWFYNTCVESNDGTMPHSMALYTGRLFFSYYRTTLRFFLFQLWNYIQNNS